VAHAGLDAGWLPRHRTYSEALTHAEGWAADVKTEGYHRLVGPIARKIHLRNVRVMLHSQLEAGILHEPGQGEETAFVLGRRAER
jgi:hypothetical protein